ncbi:nucleoside-diphosphate kinase [Candidatus Pacearchaeota archaeon RBG_13_36_9]|nr:MAG: nucleoside-diphosphate kinase [Candidatus Pacearchaeota archaeon RBG_13_36_9]
MIQQTLVLIKPDGVQRGLIGEIIKRLEQRGLKIVGMKMVHVDKSFAEKHYTEDIEKRHGKKVRDYLIDYVSHDPIIAMVIQGSSAIEVVRKIVGTTYPGESPIGTIRGDFAHVSKARAKEKNQGRNLVHASANEEDAKKELALWFSVDEIHDYKLSAEEHLI